VFVPERGNVRVQRSDSDRVRRHGERHPEREVGDDATSRNVGIFGDAMTLSGTISSKAAGQHVTVSATPASGPALNYPATTEANGNW
jgi:hypothetical protein